MNPIFEKLSEFRIVPVIVINDAAQAVPLAKALLEGGLPCAEVTFRTAAAADAIRAITRELPEMLVGAGTVLTCEQVDRAIDAGAKFLVAPGLNPETVKHSRGVPFLPGAITPTEIEAALALGLEVVKFFPAEAAGGVKMLQALSAPYKNLKFVPTGGIGPANLHSYLGLKCVAACGGSWMVKDDLINSGNFAEITKLTKEAVELARIGE